MTTTIMLFIMDASETPASLGPFPSPSPAGGLLFDDPIGMSNPTGLLVDGAPIGGATGLVDGDGVVGVLLIRSGTGESVVGLAGASEPVGLLTAGGLVVVGELMLGVAEGDSVGGGVASSTGASVVVVGAGTGACVGSGVGGGRGLFVGAGTGALVGAGIGTFVGGGVGEGVGRLVGGGTGALVGATSGVCKPGSKKPGYPWPITLDRFLS